MVRAVAFSLKLGTAVFILTLCMVTAYTALAPLRTADEIGQVDVIICLGGGAVDQQLDEGSTRRTDHCIELFEAGVAPRVHFTGTGPGPLAGARGMAARALAMGLPPEAISIETMSHSTLQNALFSQIALEGTRSSVLVSDAFHLPRAWASFQAMGYRDIQVSPSARMAMVSFEISLGSDRLDAAFMLVRESLAIWFNAGRLVVWWGLGIIGLDGRDALLA